MDKLNSHLGAVAETPHDPMIDQLVALLTPRLTQEEGDRSKPYYDTKGKLTIGIGRNLDDVGLSQDEIEYLFRNDIRRAVAELNLALPWWRTTLSVNRASVLVDLTFNEGINHLLGFHLMLDALKSDDYVRAARELLDSKYAQEVGQRASDLAGILLRG